ncbi:MAG: molybdopterin molybdotransferase MoeA [Planctomycetota bacterium]
MSRTTTWGRDAHQLLTLDQAWNIIRAQVKPLGIETVPLANAHRRVLVAPVVAENDAPAFDKAMMDGYAVRSADGAQPGATLRVCGLVAAGEAVSTTLGVGEAIQINTGAPVPKGADAVVRIEDTRLASNGTTVALLVAPRPGMNISLRAADRRRGDTVLTPPLRLEAVHLAAAASAGASMLTVSRIVDVALLTTGNELVPAGSPRRPGQIHESNGLMLSALVRQFDAVPHDFGIARDTIVELRPKLVAAMCHPVVIVSGGMSMGTLDLVPKVLSELGVQWLFHGVDMRPGKPVAYGRGPDGQHVVGLPGNPVSAFVCAWLFARMILRGLSGLPTEPPTTIRVRLASDLKLAKDPRPAFIPAKVWNDAANGLTVQPVAWGGSGDPFGLALANALLCRRDPTNPRSVGDAVDVIFLGELGA